MSLNDSINHTCHRTLTTFLYLFKDHSLEDLYMGICLIVIIGIDVCDVQFATLRELTIENLTSEDLVMSTMQPVFINNN